MFVNFSSIFFLFSIISYASSSLQLAGVMTNFITDIGGISASEQPYVQALFPLHSAYLGMFYAVIGSNNGTYLTSYQDDGTFVCPTIAIDIINPADCIADSMNRAVVIGSTVFDTGGQIMRYTIKQGQLVPDILWNNGNVTIESTNAALFKRVGEQACGRVIVMGQDSAGSNGLLIAYDSYGRLANSATNIPFGIGGCKNQLGYVTMAAATFHDMIIDQKDLIYLLCDDGQALCIARYLADGSGLDQSFGMQGIVTTNYPISSLSGKPCISFDATENFFTVAITDTAGTIYVQKYACADGSLWSFANLSQTQTGLQSPVIMQMQTDSFNRLVFVGYDAITSFVGRCLQDSLQLDPNFRSIPGFTGIVRSNNNGVDITSAMQVGSAVCINGVGAICYAGYQEIDSVDGKAFIGQIRSLDTDVNVIQQNRFPGAIITGILDTHFGFQGACDVTALLPHNTSGAIVKICTLSSGKVLLAICDGCATTLAMLDGSYQLDSDNFGNAGIVTIPNMTQVNALVNHFGTTYLLGTDRQGAVLLCLVDSQGTAVKVASIPQATATQGLTCAYDIKVQSSGRVIIAGMNSLCITGSLGCLMAYNPVQDCLDLSFNRINTPGYWYTNQPHPIVGLSIGNSPEWQDRIYILYKNRYNQAIVDCLLPCATAHDDRFSCNTAIDLVQVDAPIFLRFDQIGNILLVAQTGQAENIIVAKYQADGTMLVAPKIVMDSSDKVSLISTITSSDGMIEILGQADNVMYLIRLTSDCNFDVAFNPFGSSPGTLATTVHAHAALVDKFYDLAIISTGNFLVAGSTEKLNRPMLTSIANSTNPTAIGQNCMIQATAGLLDQSLQVVGNQPGYINISQIGLPADAWVQVLCGQSDGSYFVGATTTHATYLMKLSADNQFEYLAENLKVLMIQQAPELTAMMISQLGQLWLIGGQAKIGSRAGWVRCYDTATGFMSDGFIRQTEVNDVLDSHNFIAQQMSGRILVAGILDGAVAVIAYNSRTGAVDRSFGVHGCMKLSNYHSIVSMVVESNDLIYLLVHDGQNTIYQLSCAADGTQIYGISDPCPTVAIEHGVVAACNQDGNYIIATVAADGLDQIIVTQMCVGFTPGALENQLIIPFDQVGFTAPVLTSLLIDTMQDSGAIVITGYDVQSGGTFPFVMRIAGDLSSIDRTFNQYGPIAGIVMKDPLNIGINQWKQGIIHADGSIILAGNMTSVMAAYMIKIYGNQFVFQFRPLVGSAQLGNVGELDITFGQTKSGPGTGVITLESMAAQAIVVDQDGSLLVVSDGSIESSDTNISNISLALYHQDGSLDDSFGQSGMQNIKIGYCQQHVSSMLAVKTANQINVAILAGYVKHQSGMPASLLMQYNLDTQQLDPQFGGKFGNCMGTTVGDCKKLYKIATQSNGRIIGAGIGYDDMPLLVGYTPVGSIDYSFGFGGYVQLHEGKLHDMIIDFEDRIIVAYQDKFGMLTVAKFLSDGSDDINFSTILVGSSDLYTGIKIAMSQNNRLVIATMLDQGTCCNLSCYDRKTGTVDTSQHFVMSHIALQPWTICACFVDISDTITIICSCLQESMAAILHADSMMHTISYVSHESIESIIGAAVCPDGRLVIV